MSEHLPECPWFPNTHEDVTCRDRETGFSFCEVIAKVREDEGDRYDGMAKVHWDAGHEWGLHDAEQGLIKGLWIGWAIGTIFLMPVIILVMTR